MNKDKQIEKLADDLRTLSVMQYNPNFTPSYQTARGLYALGYRTVTDVLEELRVRIEKRATNTYPRKVRLDVVDQIMKEMTVDFGENLK